MPKNIFIYPCDNFVGSSVANAFSAAGHAVSGFALQDTDVPSSVKTFVRAADSDAAAAHKQLLLTADVVIYDLLGNERATRDALVQLAQQPYGGREVLFVAVSSPLVWAATRPSPTALFAAAGTTGGAATRASGEWGEDDASGEVDGAWPGAGAGDRSSGTGTGLGDGEEPGVQSAVGSGGAGARSSNPADDASERAVSPPAPGPTFKAPEDVPRRLPAATARTALVVENLVLRAGRKGRLRTAVVCPGLLYGEGEDDLAFCNAFKAAWTWQVLQSPKAAPGPSQPRLLVYGKGTNVLPTLHVADLAAYIAALAGVPLPWAPGAPAAGPAGQGPAGQEGAHTPGGLAAMSTPGLPQAPSTAPSLATPAASQLVGGGGSALSGSTALALSGAISIVGAGGGGTGGTGGSSSFLSAGAGSGGSGCYLLVTDGSRCTQAELMTAIAAALGLGPAEGAIQYIPQSELHLHPPALRNRMLLDLSLATTPLPARASAPSPAGVPVSVPFVPSRSGGLPAHLAAVAAEFLTARRLTPLRLLVTGPPLSGKTHLARRLAHRYDLTYINVPLLLAAAADPAVAAAAGLSPTIDPALLRTAQLEVAAGPGPVKEKEKDKDKDKEGPSPGWLPTGGRVSARTLGALLGAALADPRCAARCRGFVLDGYPRSAAQARAAFYSLQVDEVAAAALAAEQSHAKVGSKSHRADRGGSPVATPSTPNISATVAAALAAASAPLGGGCADVMDVPPAMKLVPNRLTAPTHVIELDAGEEELRARLAAVAAAAEDAVTKLAGEPAPPDLDKKVGPGARKSTAVTPGAAAQPGGGKGGSGLVPREVLLAAALGHNGEAGFTRRLAAFAGWRAEDAADLRARVAAVQASWEAESARVEAERSKLEAEASTLKAKRRKARAAAAAAGGGKDDIEMESEDSVAAGASRADVGQPAQAQPEGPELPEHGGLLALSLGAGGGTLLRLPNASLPEGPVVTLPVQPPAPGALASGPGGLAAATSGAAGPTSIATVVAAAAAQTLSSSPPPPPPALPPLEGPVEALLGPPHNLVGFPEQVGAATEAMVAASAAEAPGAGSVMPSSVKGGAAAGLPQGGERSEGSVSTVDSRAPPPATAAALPPAAAAASESLCGLAFAVKAGAEASYNNRWRGSRGTAVRRYLLRHVMPVVTAALAEVALARTGAGAGAGMGAGMGTGTRGATPGTSGSGGVPGVATAAAASGAPPGAGAGLPGDVAGGGSVDSLGQNAPVAAMAAAAAVAAVGRAPGSAPGPACSGKEALIHVARALATAAEEAEAAFVDPYSDPSYAIQLAKIDAKAAREAARAAVAAAKAEREAAARQQLAAKDDLELQQQS